MGPADAARPAPPERRHVVAVALLLACLLGIGSAHADDEADTPPAPASAARSTLASERRAAEQRLIAEGAAALPLVRSWASGPDVRLRGAAWRVLAAIGTARDVRAAVDALSDPQPQVGRAAAEAVVALAAARPLPAEPWIPDGTLAESGVRPLAMVLAERLESVPPETVPACLHRLGEGVVPSLHFLCGHPRYGVPIRERALTALARVGGERARATLARSWSALPERRGGAWWRALAEVGPGSGLDVAYEAAADYPERLKDSYRHFRRRLQLWMHWRDQLSFFRFLSTCPPPEDASELRWLVRFFLDEAARSRFPPFPGLIVEVLRAHLVLGDPTDESLEAAIAAIQVPHRHFRRRADELAGVLILLEPYKGRAGVRDHLPPLLARDDLPRSVRVWALYLEGKTDPSELAAQATALIRADDDAVSVAQQRAGLRLWERLGQPPPDLVRALFGDFLPSARALALRWATAVAAHEDFSRVEAAAAVERGLRDPADEVFLLAVEIQRGDLGVSPRERLLRLALEGRRAERGRAWRSLARLAGRRTSGSEVPFAAPLADAGLDERIRAVAALRRLFGP